MPPLVGEFATVAEAFEAAAVQFADRTAYVDGGSGDRWTFAEWFQRSDALAGDLVASGVAPGDVVAITLGSGFDYAVAYGAVMLAGGVATGINPRLGRREIAAILERSEPKRVLGDIEDIARTRGARALGARRPTRHSDDPAVIIWTSGTTGIPKGAWFDHLGLRAAVASAGVMSAPFDVKLVATPFSHAGYMAKLWDQLAWATTAVVSPTPWRSQDMLRLLIDERITVAGGVPTQWAKLLERPDVAAADLSHVRVGLVATAPAPPELIERVAETIGCPLVVRYAMTESPSITGTEPDDPAEAQFRTVGRPQKGMAVEIVDAEGRVLAPGEIGHVRVSGSCVMRGYWRDAALTATVLSADGRLMSSDLGLLRSDGNLVLVGRSSDMYIRGGYNVYPLEVENVLVEHPAIEHAAVVGASASVIGEIGVAFIVVAAGAQPPSLADIRVWVGERLADYKAPDRLEVLDMLPLTAMMKVDKAALVERARTTENADR